MKSTAYNLQKHLFRLSQQLYFDDIASLTNSCLIQLILTILTVQNPNFVGYKRLTSVMTNDKIQMLIEFLIKNVK